MFVLHFFVDFFGILHEHKNKTRIGSELQCACVRVLIHLVKSDERERGSVKPERDWDKENVIKTRHAEIKPVCRLNFGTMERKYKKNMCNIQEFCKRNASRINCNWFYAKVDKTEYKHRVWWTMVPCLKYYN